MSDSGVWRHETYLIFLLNHFLLIGQNFYELLDSDWFRCGYELLSFSD